MTVRGVKMGSVMDPPHPETPRDSPGPRPPDPRAAEAVQTARLLLRADIGLIDGTRALYEHLTSLGEFAQGEFSGEFASIALFSFESEPYPSASQRARWS